LDNPNYKKTKRKLELFTCGAEVVKQTHCIKVYDLEEDT
jgi:hypothetical protein